MRRVAVIGLGEVGLPTALYCKYNGLDVVGVDISPQAVKAAEKEGLNAVVDLLNIAPVNAYIVCVDTKSKKDGTPVDVMAVLRACESIQLHRAKYNLGGIPVLVSVESTVIPGTTRTIYKSIFDSCKFLNIVHVPQRFWGKDPQGRGVRRHRLIGGIDSGSLQAGIDLYCGFMNMPLYPTKLEEAEFAKVSENALRYVQIAVAEELKMICDAKGIDYDRVREAVNTASEMHYLPEARDGVGGHCLPMAADWLEFLSESFEREMSTASIFSAAKAIDVEYRSKLEYNGDDNDPRDC